MHVLFSKKTLVTAFLVLVGVAAVAFGAPARAATTQTQVETVIRVYNAAGIITIPEVTLVSDPKNLTQAGFDYRSGEVVPAARGSFYVGVRGKTPYLIGNSTGQGGLYRLKKVGTTTPLRRLGNINRSGVSYTRSGLTFGKDTIFAVYDENDATYFKIRVLSVKLVNVVKLEGTPTITAPANDAAVNSSATSVRVAWNGVTGATSYTLALYCTSCEAEWEPRTYGLTGASRSFVLPLNNLPSGKQYYYLTVKASTGRETTPASFPVYFTYTNDTISTVGTPTITSPSKDQVFTTSPRTITVQWSNSTSAVRYELAVDCDSCAGMTGWKRYQTYSALPANMTSQAVTLPQDGSYSVSVRAFDLQGVASDWSEKIMFRFGAGITPGTSTIVPPTIVGPTAGQVLTYYPRAIRASWWKVAGASAYELSLECQSCEAGTAGWKELSQYTINNMAGNANTLDIPAVSIDSEYRLRMRSLDGASKKGPWSEYTYFRFSTINVGVPVISSPTMNQTLTNNPRTFGVMWNAVNQAVSYVVEVSCKNCATTAWGKVDYYPTIDTNPWLAITAPGDDMYRVRVQAVDQYNNHTAWSEYVNFSFVTTAGMQIAAPRITGPAAGGEVSNSTKQVSLSWNSVGSQYRYEILVECNSCGTSSGWQYWRAYRTPDASNSYIITVPQNALYRFQVRAVDVDANRTGQWSELTTFSYRMN